MGGTAARQVDVRVVAATNRDLEAEVRAGRFREDLYYRVGVVTLELPPLRSYKDNLEILSQVFLQQAAQRHGRKVSRIAREAVEALNAYDFPGNVRELQNEVQRLVIQAESDEPLGTELLSPRVRQAEDLVLGATTAKGTLKTMVDQVERQILQEALREHNNNKTAAAKALGITREGLHKKLKQLGVT